MIVINDLGTDVLLGQPTKVDNCIVTVPHLSRIEFKCVEGGKYNVSYPLRSNYSVRLHDVLKINSSTTLYPGDQYVYHLPNQFIIQKKVMVTERPTDKS